MISHTILCPDFWTIFCGIFGAVPPNFEFEDILLLDSDWVGSSFDRTYFVLLGTHICFLVYNACMYHKLHQYSRTHNKVTKLMRRIRFSFRSA